MMIRRALLSLALIAGSSPAFAQGVPFYPQTMPSDSFVGRIQPGSGPSSAIPIASLLARIATPNSVSNSILFKAPAATLKGNPTAATANVQDFTIQGLPARGAPDANNDKILIFDNATGLFKYVTPGQVAASATSGVSSIGGVTGALTIPAGGLQITSGQLAINTLSSRTFAITQNLSSFNAVRTLGYAAAGDGGGATFKNVGSAPFIDSFITTYTVVGGSACTDGTYYGVIWQSGSKPFVVGTAVSSGGTITAVNIANTPGNGYAVGDVLTTSTIPGCVGTSLTVTAVSVPLASFTDSVGTHFQIVTAPWPNVLQFGAKGDWNGVDGSATDNFNAIQAAYWFAGYKSSTSFDSGGFWGGRVDFPQGSYMACGTGLKPLILPQGVGSWGASGSGSTISFCSAWDANTVQMELGDPNAHFACFNTELHHMVLRSSSGTAYMGHSNCAQDFGGLYQTYFYSNGGSGRPCFHYEKGYGGASTFVIRDVSCSANSNSAMFWIGNSVASGLNLGTTMVEMTNIVMGGSSAVGGSHQTGTGILINGGFVNIDRFHFESMVSGVTVAIPATGNADVVTIQNGNGGSGVAAVPCIGVVVLDGTNLSGNAVISQIQAGATCTHTINNGQSSGVSYDPAVTQPAIFNPNYHSF